MHLAIVVVALVGSATAGHLGRFYGKPLAPLHRQGLGYPRFYNRDLPLGFEGYGNEHSGHKHFNEWLSFRNGWNEVDQMKWRLFLKEHNWSEEQAFEHFFHSDFSEDLFPDFVRNHFHRFQNPSTPKFIGNLDQFSEEWDSFLTFARKYNSRPGGLVLAWKDRTLFNWRSEDLSDWQYFLLKYRFKESELFRELDFSSSQVPEWFGLWRKYSELERRKRIFQQEI